VIPIYEPLITRGYARAVAKQIRSGWLGPGATVRKFEEMLRPDALRERPVATTSGTTALLLALKALGVGPEWTVILPAYGFPAAGNAARFLCAKVRLVDVMTDYPTMNPSLLRDTLQSTSTQRTVCVFIDQNGLGRALNEVNEVCNNFGVPLVEDACQAYFYGGHVGRFATWSFSPLKPITTGQGGAVLFGVDSQTAKHDRQKVLELIDHGGLAWRTRKMFDGTGCNFRMSDVSAALGVPQLRHQMQILKRKQRVFEWYDRFLGAENAKVRWFMTYCSRTPDKLMGWLASRGVETKQFYGNNGRTAEFNPDGRRFDAAESASKEIIYLPSSPGLTRRQVQYICNSIRDFEAQYR
jgi:perosamine synthetase